VAFMYNARLIDPIGRIHVINALSKCWWHVISSSDGPDSRRESRFFHTAPTFDDAINFKFWIG